MMIHGRVHAPERRSGNGNGNVHGNEKSWGLRDFTFFSKISPPFGGLPKATPYGRGCLLNLTVLGAFRIFALAISCAHLAAADAPAAEDPPLTGPATEKRFPPLKVPAGFEVTLFACDPLVAYPSAIARGPRVGSLFVVHDYMTGLGTKIVRRDEVRLVEDTDGDGYADKSTLYAGGLNSVMGLAYHTGAVYAMHSPFLTALRDTDGDGAADERRDLLTGLGLPPEENPVRLHGANGIAVGHDNWLYLALGDHGCDVTRPEGDRLVFEGGGILRCRPDGRDLHVFSTGLRNIYDVALDEELNVFVRDNENDGGDYKIRVCHSFFGADHGYPYLYYERPDEALAPLADLGLGSSAGGICYLEPALPPEYRGDLFFCEWGRAVVRYRRERAGSSFAPMREIEFASGADTDPYGFKPTDLVVDHDGSLIVADWADGQRPKRGRARIYRIRYGGKTTPETAPTRSGGERSPGDWIAPLDAASYLMRTAAQRAIESWGAAGRVVLLCALQEGTLGVRGRLHGVWILARRGGPASVRELFSLAARDPEPRVRAQAVRALADLHDPVFLRHRLDPGPADPVAARRFVELLKDPDARVLLEVITALGRLGWTAAPTWLRATSRELDPALTHAIMMALRRSQNWTSVLELLDLRAASPAAVAARPLALRALAGLAHPTVVDGWIARLLDPSPARRLEYADALTRVYKRPGPWVYWGYRPPPRPPATVTWDRTAEIEAALDRVLADPSREVRTAALLRMQRENIPARLNALALWLEEERDEKSVAAILASLEGHPVSDVSEPLAGVVADRGHAVRHRLAALEMLARRASDSTANGLLEIAAAIEDGSVLAATLRHLGDGRETASVPLLRRKLRSLDPDVRAVAIEALATLGVEEAGAQVRALLEDEDVRVRRAAAAAVGRLGVREAALPLLAFAAGSDMPLKRASLDSLRMLGDRRALPFALDALTSRETQAVALEYVADLGGPKQADSIVDVAGKDPSGDTLRRVVRILTRWQTSESPSSPRWLALDRAVARVQGRSGVLVRWSTTGPLPPDAASSLAAEVSRGEPGGEQRRDNWRTAFATGSAERLRLGSSEAAPQGAVWLAFSDVALDERADVQFLASSSGTLKVSKGGRPLYERLKPGPFRPDSERFEATLAKGMNRLVVEVSGSPSVEFRLRYRRASSTPERERLARLALAGKGSAQRGRAVFFDAEKARCITCHRLGGEGGSIGPDLTGVGRRFSRIHMIESILEPSRAIAPSFDTMVVVLEGGRVLTGVKVSETETTLTLRYQDGQSHVLEKASIVERQAPPQSIMPDGLEMQLSEREFVDLIAFLLAQKKA